MFQTDLRCFCLNKYCNFQKKRTEIFGYKVLAFTWSTMIPSCIRVEKPFKVDQALQRLTGGWELKLWTSLVGEEPKRGLSLFFRCSFALSASTLYRVCTTALSEVYSRFYLGYTKKFSSDWRQKIFCCWNFSEIRFIFPVKKITI